MARTGFNSRPREGATEAQRQRREDIVMFQLTPPRGGDLAIRRPGPPSSPVSTHAPARGRRGLADARSRDCLFQLTPPRGGDLRRCRLGAARLSFNSRPREGATAIRRPGPPSSPVSTHAPARGRPIHAWITVRQSSCFNSRPREGATMGRGPGRRGAGVSTHAPARGRRRSPAGSRWSGPFQLTPPRGGDFIFRSSPGIMPE